MTKPYAAMPILGATLLLAGAAVANDYPPPPGPYISAGAWPPFTAPADSAPPVARSGSRMLLPNDSSMSADSGSFAASNLFGSAPAAQPTQMEPPPAALPEPVFSTPSAATRPVSQYVAPGYGVRTQLPPGTSLPDYPDRGPAPQTRGRAIEGFAMDFSRGSGTARSEQQAAGTYPDYPMATPGDGGYPPAPQFRTDDIYAAQPGYPGDGYANGGYTSYAAEAPAYYPAYPDAYPAMQHGGFQDAYAPQAGGYAAGSAYPPSHGQAAEPTYDPAGLSASGYYAEPAVADPANPMPPAQAGYHDHPASMPAPTVTASGAPGHVQPPPPADRTATGGGLIFRPSDGSDR